MAGGKALAIDDHFPSIFQQDFRPAGRVKPHLSLRELAVRGGGKEYLIPAVDAFLRGTDVDAGWVRVHLIEGMER